MKIVNYEMCDQLTLVFILLASSSVIPAPDLVSALQQHFQRKCIFFLFPDDRNKPERLTRFARWALRLATRDLQRKVRTNFKVTAPD
uniref:Uncharacterized protein n=1 Tax=Timema monikensis TaxID=170555 RepID=A0A7R9EI26_9NEOP|nr:unnamed protein product [Timema monikensis]